MHYSKVKLNIASDMPSMKVNIYIDKNSPLPVYRQIVSVIDSMIEKGTLREGDVLPSMNELAEKIEISKEM